MSEGYELESKIGIVPIAPFLLALYFQQLFVLSLMYGNLFENVPSLIWAMIVGLNVIILFLYFYLKKKGHISFFYSQIQAFLRTSGFTNTNTKNVQLTIVDNAGQKLKQKKFN